MAYAIQVLIFIHQTKYKNQTLLINYSNISKYLVILRINADLLNLSNQQEKLSHLQSQLKMSNKQSISQKADYQLPSNLHKQLPSQLTPNVPFIKMKRLPEIDDSLLILTEYMSLNVSFTSPLLQAVDFLQQYHKYRLRSVLSTFPIASQTFDNYYNEIQNTIMLKYKKNVTRIMKIVYEMLNVANCQKLNQMKMYHQLFSKVKSQLLLNRSSTDPYHFRPQQFDSDMQIVIKTMQFCEKFLNLHNTPESQNENKQKIKKENQNFRMKAKQQIQKLTQKIKSKTIFMMDQMNNCQVNEPYRPQNQAFSTINFPAVLDSFYKKMKIKNNEIDQSLEKRRFSIEKQVRNMLEEGLKQYKKQTSCYATELIENYNRDSLHKRTEINSHCQSQISCSPLNLQKYRSMDTHDLTSINFSNQTESKTVLKNIRKQVKINNLIKIIDLDSNTEGIVELRQNTLPMSKIKNQTKQQFLDLQIQYDASVNPFIISKRTNNKFHFKTENKVNYFQKENFQQNQKPKQNIRQQLKRLEEDFYEYNKRQKAQALLHLERNPSFYVEKQILSKKNFILMSLFQDEYHNLIKSEVQTQIIDTPSKPFQKKKISNQTQQKLTFAKQKSHHFYIFFKNQQQKNLSESGYSNFSQADVKKIETQNDSYQTQRKADYERKMQSLSQLIQIKNYMKFCALSINPKTKKGGLDTNTYLKGQIAYRYGIQIKSKWQDYTINNSSAATLKLPPTVLENLNKFFFYYFKERYYRQNKMIEENSQIPILMTLENQNQFLNEKMMKKIMTLMKKFQFFILWTLNDIIFYEEKLEFGKRKALITINIFSSTDKSATGLIWQLRKRLNDTFKQQSEKQPKDLPLKSKSNTKNLKYELDQRLQYQFYHHKNVSQNKDTINEILSKIQCVHRSLYNRHKKQLSLEKTIQKGKQLWNQILSKKLFC